MYPSVHVRDSLSSSVPAKFPHASKQHFKLSTTPTRHTGADAGRASHASILVATARFSPRVGPTDERTSQLHGLLGKAARITLCLGLFPGLSTGLRSQAFSAGSEIC